MAHAGRLHCNKGNVMPCAPDEVAAKNVPRLAVMLPHGEEAIDSPSDTTPLLLVAVLKECVQVGAGDIFYQAHNGFHLCNKGDKLSSICTSSTC